MPAQEHRLASRRICSGLKLSIDRKMCFGLDYSVLGVGLILHGEDATTYYSGQSVELTLSEQSNTTRHLKIPGKICSPLPVGSSIEGRRIGVSFEPRSPGEEARIVSFVEAQNTLSEEQKKEYDSLRSEIITHANEAHQITTGTIAVSLTFLGACLALNNTLVPVYMIPFFHLLPFVVLWIGHHLFNSPCLRMRRIASYLGYFFETRVEGLSWERYVHGIRKISRDQKHNVVDILRVAKGVGLICLLSAVVRFVFAADSGVKEKTVCWVLFTSIISAWYLYFLPRIKRHTNWLCGASLAEEEEYCFLEQLNLHGGKFCNYLKHIHDSFDVLFWRTPKSLEEIRAIEIDGCPLGDGCPLRTRVESLRKALEKTLGGKCLIRPWPPTPFRVGLGLCFLLALALLFKSWMVDDGRPAMLSGLVDGIDAGSKKVYAFVISHVQPRKKVDASAPFQEFLIMLGWYQNSITQAITGLVMLGFATVTFFLPRILSPLILRRRYLSTRGRTSRAFVDAIPPPGWYRDRLFLEVGYLCFLVIPAVLWSAGAFRIAWPPGFGDKVLLYLSVCLVPLWLTMPARRIGISVEKQKRRFLIPVSALKGLLEKDREVWKHSNYLMRGFPPDRLTESQWMPLGIWLFYELWTGVWRVEKFRLRFSEKIDVAIKQALLPSEPSRV